MKSQLNNTPTTSITNVLLSNFKNPQDFLNPKKIKLMLGAIKNSIK
jgi:hypothetical protein